jgi:hypothetical protein
MASLLDARRYIQPWAWHFDSLNLPHKGYQSLMTVCIDLMYGLITYLAGGAGSVFVEPVAGALEVVQREHRGLVRNAVQPQPPDALLLPTQFVDIMMNLKLWYWSQIKKESCLLYPMSHY